MPLELNQYFGSKIHFVTIRLKRILATINTYFDRLCVLSSSAPSNLHLLCISCHNIDTQAYPVQCGFSLCACLNSVDENPSCKTDIWISLQSKAFWCMFPKTRGEAILRCQNKVVNNQRPTGCLKYKIGLNKIPAKNITTWHCNSTINKSVSSLEYFTMLRIRSTAC